MSARSGKNSGISDFEGLYGPDDPELDARIKSFRQAELELEEILHDPGLDQARNEVASVMMTFSEMQKKDSFPESETFIRTSFQRDTEKFVSAEAKETGDEISKANVSDLSAEWVREWHRKKQMQGISAADEERKGFIASSLATPAETSGKPSEPAAAVISLQDTRKDSVRRRIISFTSLAAAAVLATFMVLKTLMPSGDTQKIYDTYYKTFQAVTPVTRGNNTASTAYVSAINSYKKGDFTEAEAGFIRAAGENPSDLSSEFYLGLSQMEAGKTDQAIRSLSAATRSGKFVKESQWYLGLAYLKKGNAEKASECFKTLASSDGYYREASEKILRRLKK